MLGRELFLPSGFSQGKEAGLRGDQNTEVGHSGGPRIRPSWTKFGRGDKHAFALDVHFPTLVRFEADAGDMSLAAQIFTDQEARQRRLLRDLLSLSPFSPPSLHSLFSPRLPLPLQLCSPSFPVPTSRDATLLSHHDQDRYQTVPCIMAYPRQPFPRYPAPPSACVPRSRTCCDTIPTKK
jgi:hypothetical protein